MENLKLKLKVLVYVPMAFVFLGSSFLLLLTNSPVLLIGNGIFFLVSLVFSKILLDGLSDKLLDDFKELHQRLDLVSFSAKLLTDEAIKKKISDGDVKPIYFDAKEILVNCLQYAEKSDPTRKDFLGIAKDLSRLCVQLKFRVDKEEEESEEHTLKLISENLIGQSKKAMDSIQLPLAEERTLKTVKRTSTLRRVMKIA